MRLPSVAQRIRPGHGRAPPKLRARRASRAREPLRSLCRCSRQSPGPCGPCLSLPAKADDLEAEIVSLLSDALTHAAQRKDYMSVVIPRAVIDRSIAKELAKFMESTRAPALAARLKQHQDAGSLSQRADADALAHGLALTMLALGFFGQIVLRLDPKLLNRIIASLADALAGAHTPAARSTTTRARSS